MEQPTTTRAVKAIALISGGLDSLLATKVILDQGIDVEGVNFFTGFCVEGHTHAIRKRQREKIKRNNALWVAEQLGIKLHIVDVVQEYKDIVLNPKYGYGKNLNPCLDCKIFMVERALNMVGFDGRTFDFAISGGSDWTTTQVRKGAKQWLSSVEIPVPTTDCCVLCVPRIFPQRSPSVKDG